MAEPVLQPVGRSQTGPLPIGIDVDVQLLSSTVHLKGASPSIVASLSTMYPGLVSDDCFHGADMVFDINATAGAVWNQPQLLGQIESDVDRAAFDHLAGFVMLHAGVVAAGEASMLFPASSGSGKSTLVAALCHSGFRYLSDEFAVLCPTSLTVHPYAKSICLKADGWRLIQEAYTVSAEPVVVQRTDGQMVRFLAAPDPFSGGHGAVVRAVVIPNRQTSGPSKLEPVAPAEALSVLIQQSLNLPWHGARGLDALARVVESADCYLLSYASLDDAVKTITDMIAAEPAWAEVT
jgi:hypothetical protein